MTEKTSGMQTGKSERGVREREAHDARLSKEQTLSEKCPKCQQLMFNHPRSLTRCARCGHEWAMKEAPVPSKQQVYNREAYEQLSAAFTARAKQHQEAEAEIERLRVIEKAAVRLVAAAHRDSWPGRDHGYFTDLERSLSRTPTSPDETSTKYLTLLGEYKQMKLLAVNSSNGVTTITVERGD